MAESEATTEEEAPKKRSKKKLLIPIVVLVLGLGGGGYFMVGVKGKKASATPTTTTTVLGPVVVLDPITTNLSDGHVLKVGLSLRMAAKPKDKTLAKAVTALTATGEGASATTTSPLEGEESVALDLAITVLGNDTYTALSSPDGKAHAKEELTKQIEEAYNHDVTDVYFNDFVMS